MQVRRLLPLTEAQGLRLIVLVTAALRAHLYGGGLQLVRQYAMLAGSI
jgi:hypothetical protein